MVRKVPFAIEAVPILLELSVVAKLIESYQHEVMMKHSGGSGVLSSLPYTAGSSERETMTGKDDEDVILAQKVYGVLVVFYTSLMKCDDSLLCFL